MVMGSSGLPGKPVISCSRALPMEVTRSVTCRVLPSSSLPVPESTPSQEPARVFILSKDFCASDFCASGFCGSDCAKATADSDTKARTDSIRRKNSCFILLKILSLRGQVCRRAECMRTIPSTISDIVNYNTMSQRKLFFGFFVRSRRDPVSMCQGRARISSYGQTSCRRNAGEPLYVDYANGKSAGMQDKRGPQGVNCVDESF